MWLPNLEGRKGPVYRAIADAIDADVESGALRAGTRLPPHRDLADHLGVTVTTVTRAYTEAARRGLTSGHVGRGTFIRGREAEEADNGLLDLSINVLMPDKEVASLEVHLMRRRVLPWTQLLGYAPKRGHLRHRQAMAAWLTYLGLPADPDHVVLTAGAQHGLATTLSALVKPGDTVLVEDLTYSGFRLLSQQMHFKLKGVAMDAEGLKPEALEAACRTSHATVLYCMPRLQNPTSAVMSEKRRRQIAAVAEKCRLTVIEDDTYGFLSPERWPLARLIPHRTVFVTSLSKSLFPGMRLGLRGCPARDSRPHCQRGLGHDNHDVFDWRRSVERLDRGRHRCANRRLEAPRECRAAGHCQADSERAAAPDASLEPAHVARAAGTVVFGGIRRGSARPGGRAERLVGVRGRHRAAEGRAFVPRTSAHARQSRTGVDAGQ